MSKSPNRFVPSGKLKALELREGSSIPVSNALSGRIRYNEVTNHLELSENTGAFASILGTEHGIITLTPLGGGADDAPQIAAAIATGKIVILAAGTWVRGAVTRTSTHAVMFDPASGVHNVEFYGALGGGVVDDTVAIQAAIDAAVVVGGKVVLPAGQYWITSTLNVRRGSLEICGAGFRCNAQARYAAAGATYDAWALDWASIGLGSGLSGTVLLFDGCDGFTRTDAFEPINARLILRGFACVSKSGSGDKSLIGWGTHTHSLANPQYHNVGAFRWNIAWDMSGQYGGRYYDCEAVGCVEAWRSGAPAGAPVATSGNQNVVRSANIDSCERGVALYECGMFELHGVMFQNSLHLVHLAPNSNNVIVGISVHGGWHETAVANARVLYVDYTGAHVGDVRMSSMVTIADLQVNRPDPANVTPFEFINDAGWGQLGGLSLRNIYDALGEYTVPASCAPLVAEQIRCAEFVAPGSNVNTNQVWVDTATAREGGYGVRVWNASSPSESTGSSWMVGKKITFAMSPYVVLATDSMLLVDTTGGAVRLVLGHVATNEGRHLDVVDWAANASVHDISIEAEAGETVDGAADIHLVVDGSAAHLYCDGLEYRTIPHV
jgi:hypothetical protein